MDGLLDWVDDYYTSLTVAATVVAGICGVGIDRYWGTLWVWAWIVGLLGASVLAALNTRRNRLQQGRRAALDCLRKLLKTCAIAFGHPRDHVRVNVMLVSDKGRTRTLNSATAFNMDADPDRDIVLDANAGVSGEAFSNRKAAFGELPPDFATSGNSWGMTPSQKGKVRRSLRSILSVPVFDALAPEGQPIATLQIDSDLPLDLSEFNTEDSRELAERFADVVSLVLLSAQ